MIKAEKGNAVISGNIACVMKDVSEKGDGRSMRNRLTIANPSGAGYRIPGCRATSLRLEWQQEQTVLFGMIADRLGEYEDLGSVEELREMKGRK